MAGAALLVAPLASAAFGPYTVNTIGDLGDNNTADHVCSDGQGHCSLRAAIEQVNADGQSSPETIQFSIAPGGTQVISPTSALPTLTRRAIVDASTQYIAVGLRRANCRASTGHPCIELSGANVGGAGGSVDGLHVSAGNSTIRGFSIVSFYDGIFLDGPGGDAVEGNWVGVDPSGNPAGNGNAGVWVVTTTASTIGGTTTGQVNVLSANRFGVRVDFYSAATIQGNLVGTNPSGTAALGNGWGVFLYGSRVVVGGTAAGARNVISGNATEGIHAQGADSTIQGNYVGTNATADAAIPNGTGITIGAARVTVGGAGGGAGNIVSGNAGGGIHVIGDAFPNSASGWDAKILGNRIGVVPALVRGIRALPNGGDGIRIDGANRGTIGGTSPGAGNTIAFNSGAGVSLVQFLSGASYTPYLNAIRGNAIFSNGGLGIDLGGDGVTPNDAGDADDGPNTRQNFPVLAYALSDGSTTTTIRGTLNSAPSKTYALDFYAGPAGSCDPSGNGEGRTYLGTANVVTDGSGNATFTQSFAVGEPDGAVLTTTATDPNGNTSEFSNCVIANGADLQISSATDTPDPVVADSPLTYSYSLYNAAGHDATNATLTVGVPSTAIASSASASQGSCTVGRPVTCNVGTLPAGAHATATVVVTPIAPGAISSTAVFAADQPDPTPGNATATLGTTVSPQPKTRYISYGDSGFASASVFVALGTTVQWNFLSGGTTDVFDNTGMNLFTSPPRSPVSYYAYTFTASGGYSVSDGGERLMAVKVKLSGPATASVNTAFRVRWASAAPPAGYVFDVQVAGPGGAFQPFRTGTTQTSALYTPTVAGSYRFRALMRNGGGSAAYSPVLAVSAS